MLQVICFFATLIMIPLAYVAVILYEARYKPSDHVPEEKTIEHDGTVMNEAYYRYQNQHYASNEEMM